MQRQIKWERWQDPINKVIKKAHDDEEDRPYRDSYEEMERGTGPALIGPMGVVPLHESNVPSKLYNFWMGHTNFGITKTLRNTIEAVEGVETLDVFTRYRFRLGIGKAFEEADVLENIAKSVCVLSPAELSGLDALKATLSKRSKFWIIYELDNGKYEVSTGSTKEEALTAGARFESRSRRTHQSWKNDLSLTLSTD